MALAEEIAKNEPFVVQTTKRAVNRAWDVAGFRAAMAANIELDVMIETANLPARDEFRRITQEQGLKAAIAWRDARFREDAVSVPARSPLGPAAPAGAALDRDRRARRSRRTPGRRRSSGRSGTSGSTETLYPVNPKYDTVWGRPCLSSIEELPRGVDLVVFVVPARVVVPMIDDCGARGRPLGHGRVVRVRRGGRGGAGSCRPSSARRRCRARIPVLGPNVEGFVNYVDHVAPYGTTPPPDPVAGFGSA